MVPPVRIFKRALERPLADDIEGLFAADGVREANLDRSWAVGRRGGVTRRHVTFFAAISSMEQR